ncbi:CRP/FNR family transcriptional regulator, anaerobic regulatory protein [Amphibacillus marinus]|uniref:CRP/FNR family transcriptional regulator, anaerobic regulatory protein n=1 Tax=Amphibacillus marinus TaxID=872970 RepID=A0A1H8Q8L6_9BACI|nr:Crp/Fnr family transcriptional regulator [Amphibacillus marinus]SEO50406.1 CRP/FNR family transcriptional regulator, anaerobic regulatory protein [Amphibacillus marinus]
MDKLTKINGLPKSTARYLSQPDYYSLLKKNTLLFRQGEAVKDLYIIVEGKVLLGKTSPDGRELSLRFCGPGDIIGELTWEAESMPYLVDAKVVESGTVAVFNQTRLRERIREDQNAMTSFLNLANLQYRKDQTKFRDLVLHGKKGALYSTLIRLSNSYGKKSGNGILIDVKLTNQELASFCATSREAVNRMLNELKRKEIILIDSGQITIVNLNYLKQAINCENCPLILCTIQ